jgi:two-component system response regulator FixJ
MDCSSHRSCLQPVAVIDDDEAVLDSLQVLLMTEGMDVETYESGEAFLNAADSAAYECILLDVHLPGLDGFEVAERLKGTSFKGTVILMTGRPDDQIRRLAAARGVATLLEKPIRSDALIAAIERGLAAGSACRSWKNT